MCEELDGGVELAVSVGDGSAHEIRASRGGSVGGAAPLRELHTQLAALVCARQPSTQEIDDAELGEAAQDQVLAPVLASQRERLLEVARGRGEVARPQMHRSEVGEREAAKRRPFLARGATRQVDQLPGETLGVVDSCLQPRTA
jgi:hypothetical protein